MLSRLHSQNSPRFLLAVFPSGPEKRSQEEDKLSVTKRTYSQLSEMCPLTKAVLLLNYFRSGKTILLLRHNLLVK